MDFQRALEHFHYTLNSNSASHREDWKTFLLELCQSFIQVKPTKMEILIILL